MGIILLRVSALLYSIASIAMIVHMVRAVPGGGKRGMYFLYAALVTHSAAVVGRAMLVSAFPMADVHDALSLFGFILASISTFVAVRGRVPQVAFLTTPLVGLLVVIGAAGEPTATVPTALGSLWLGTHISLALLGDAAFVVAGVVAVVYLMQERRLRSKKRRPRGRSKEGLNPKPSSAMDQLPALEALDKVSVALFKFGFPLMTLGILTGMLYGKRFLGVYWEWDARNTVSALVWLLYAAMLHARLVIGWRGRKAAILTVVGVIAILLTFVGLGLTSVGIHGREYVS